MHGLKKERVPIIVVGGRGLDMAVAEDYNE